MAYHDDTDRRLAGPGDSRSVLCAAPQVRAPVPLRVQPFPAER